MIEEGREGKMDEMDGWYEWMEGWMDGKGELMVWMVGWNVGGWERGKMN